MHKGRSTVAFCVGMFVVIAVSAVPAGSAPNGGRATRSGAPPASSSSATEHDGPLARSQQLRKQGDALLQAGKYAEAMAQYRASLKIVKQTGDKAEATELVTTLGTAGFSRAAYGGYADAVELADMTDEAARVSGDRNDLASAQQIHALVLKYQSRYAEALPLFEKALATYRETGAQSTVANVLNSIGNIQRELGRPAEALATHQESLKIYHGLGDTEKQALVTSNLGDDYQAIGKYPEAIAQFQASLDFRRELKDSANIGQMLTTLGNTYQNNGQFAEALASYEEARKVFKEAGYTTDETKMTARIEDLHLQVGDLPIRPVLALQLGHNNLVSSVAFSSDGRIVASGSWDNTIKLWNASNGQLLQTLLGHNRAVNAIAFSPNGSRLVSASSDGTVRLWDVTTGALLRTLVEHGDIVYSVAFSPDGRMIASGSEDKLALLWDAETGAVLRTLRGHAGNVCGVAFAPKEKTLATASADGTVKLWDTQTGALLRTLTGDTQSVNDVAFSPDGKTIASAGADRTVKLWNAQTGALLHTLAGHTNVLYSVRFSPDGTMLGSGGYDNTARLWDAHSGKLLRTIPNGAWPVWAVAFSPNGNMLAGGSYDKTVKLWDTASGTLTRTLPGVSHFVTAVQFTRDDKGLICQGVEDQNPTVMRLWDVTTGVPLRTITAPRVGLIALGLAPDNRTLITFSKGHPVEMWDSTTGKFLWALPGDSGSINTVTFNHDGTVLASVGKDRSLKLWNMGTGKLVRTISDVSPAALSIVLSGDGTRAATLMPSKEGDASAGVLKVWDTATGKAVGTPIAHGSAIDDFDFSPDGKVLVTGGEDHRIRLWDAHSGTLLHTCIGHTDAVKAVAFSPNGKMLATASEDWTVRLWEVASGKLLRTLEGHSGVVLSVAFSQDGKRVASGGFDNTLRLWDPQSGRLLATLFSLPDDESKPTTENYFVLTPEGYYSGSAEAERYVRFRLGKDLYPAESFHARFYRPELIKDALSGKELPPVGDFKGVFPPTVIFTSLVNGDKVVGDTITVQLDATDDSDVKRVEFRVNGARVDVQPQLGAGKALLASSKALLAASKGIPTAHKIERPVEARITLRPSDTSIRLEAVAYDDDGLQSRREEVLLRRDPRAVTQGKLLGLCVGISRYADSALNLQHADQDATALQEALSLQRGMYSGAEITALTNEKATADNVRTALDDLISHATSADTVILFLSGHGWHNDRSFYFATHEVNRNDIPDTTLAWDDVVQRLIRLSEKSRRVMVLLDACHSGSAATNEELVTAVNHANAGVLVFSSSRGSEESFELADKPHGAFTQALLEAFQGGAAAPGESQISILRLLDFVSQRVKASTNDQQHPHIPLLQDFDPNEPIALKEN